MATPTKIPGTYYTSGGRHFFKRSDGAWYEATGTGQVNGLRALYGRPTDVPMAHIGQIKNSVEALYNATFGGTRAIDRAAGSSNLAAPSAPRPSTGGYTPPAAKPGGAQSPVPRAIPITGGGQYQRPTDLLNPAPSAPSAPSAPKRDFKAEARALFPWMPAELVNVYASEWKATGNADLAMAKVRSHRSYERHFPGNTRDDGSLRFSEAGYISQKVGFAETMREYGLTPPSSFKGLFEGEVTAGEFAQGLGQAAAMFTEPGRRPPKALLNAFAKGFTDSGSAVDALADVRESSEYGKIFEGIFRDDGTLRMTEQEYFATKQGMRSWLAEYGLNPNAFERGIIANIKGDTSVEEFAYDLQTTSRQVLSNTDAVREAFAQQFGHNIDFMSDTALLAAVIDPQMGQDLLDRKIAASFVGGEAISQGFRRSAERADQLARAGVTQAQARTLYSQAGTQVPLLQTLVERYNDPDDTFGLTDFEDALALGDYQQRTRMQRRIGDELSAFSRASDVRQDDEGGLTGLIQR